MGKKFYGKISRVMIYSRSLDRRREINAKNTNVSALFPNDILRWKMEEYHLSATVKRLVPSEADQSCPLNYEGVGCQTLKTGLSFSSFYYKLAEMPALPGILQYLKS